ncbi:SDH family Clp fold serine proteinase [Cerasicoccus maritimus]|uniref:SDH family Clp fold serine proteinase n=1 Tax=Cerasicoccus maritimus TaxID=490089 RepID=UPI002852BC43|nr:hypothetical protein [Cerasicoccus maritimus]
MNKSDVEVKQPPVLFEKTQELIPKLEERLNGVFLTYWNSTNGSVCGNDVIGFYEVLNHIGKTDTLYLFIKSDGGNGTVALRIVNLLRNYAKKIIVLIPLECASAATMMALGSDKILMGPLSYLTAVDTSITHSLSPMDKYNNKVSVSLDEVSRLLNLWNEQENEQAENPYKFLYDHIHPLVIGAVDRASSLSIRLCKEILSFHIESEEEAKRISEVLNSEYPSHSYPITMREAQRIGLNVDSLDPDVNDLLLDLNECYSEMGQIALTDYDENNYHNNEILNILEGNSIQIFYQNDKDWHYRNEERRWVPMNDESGWHKIIKEGDEIKKSMLYVR